MSAESDKLSDWSQEARLRKRQVVGRDIILENRVEANIVDHTDDARHVLAINGGIPLGSSVGVRRAIDTIFNAGCSR